MLNRGYQFLKKENDMYVYERQSAAVMVWFMETDKLNVDAMKDFIIVMDQMKIKHGIIIYHKSVTLSTKKILEQMYKYKIELFAAAEFRYDLTNHMYYTAHRKLEPTEAEEIVARFGSKLPILLKSDPVARYFNFTRHDIIEITRKNGSIAYRTVR